MRENDPRSQRDEVADHLYDLGSGDPTGELFDRSTLSPDEVAQISRLMKALVDLRETEQAILDASEKYMKLSSQDMRALHYLIVARNRGEVVTPSMIAAFLKISPASTTKLLNRLERGGHITRHLHPTDRRAFAIRITPQTEASAKQTVGRQHAKRMHAAVRLTSAEREIVIGFLHDMAREISMDNADWSVS
ncbi:MarR family winged helix-turn-helix transcriptional regulator [Microbacterium sp. No. 7]|uniref:MarR family winged helix-turn-helix transcriptional regulator n=1 Tax=Microbacterium sp. No. 7 TaxID=1714373 RepID=UPI0006D0AA88|nr:MarR family transcriptional regulator [Microbacterium sp. No. 7]ALJ18443.1 MarR family transcriptional regulator [Microbacterium sp. No. 7]